MLESAARPDPVGPLDGGLGAVLGGFLRPSESPDGDLRALVEARLVSFVRIVAALTLGLTVLVGGLALTFGDVLVHALRAPAVFLAVSLLSFALPVPLRRRELSLGRLVAFDVVITGAIAAATTWAIALLPGMRPTDIASNMVLTFVLVLRASIVPSPAARTALVGLLGAGASTATMIVALGSATSPPSIDRTAAAVGFVGWSLLTVAVTTLTSHMIHGLQVRMLDVMRLGQYTLLEKIGQGGMGAVWRAQHARLRREAAVKILSRERATSHDLARFEREVQLTSTLRHENIVMVYDYGRAANGALYYAMELVDGRTLEQLVDRDGPLSEARVIGVLMQLCDALVEAHGRGLVHRDIKPGNVLLCERDGRSDFVKVVDFGLVKQLGARADGITQANLIAGTPGYMAPEMITSPETIDARSDLYGVGGLAYFLLTGKQVFEGSNLVDICSQHLRSEPIAPSRRVGRPVDGQLERLVLSCLAKDPRDRPSDARALGLSLAALARSATISD